MNSNGSIKTSNTSSPASRLNTLQASAPTSPRDKSMEPATDIDAIGRDTERIAAEAAEEARRMAQEAREDAAKALTENVPTPMTERAKDPFAGDEPNQQYMKGHAKKGPEPQETLETSTSTKEAGDPHATNVPAPETVNTDDALSKARFAAKDAGNVQLPKKENAVQKVGSYLGSWLNFVKGTTTGTFHIVQSGIRSAANAVMGPKQLKASGDADKKADDKVKDAESATAPNETIGAKARRAMDKSKQVSATTWNATKDASARGWSSTKDASAKAWSKTCEASAAGWQKVRDATSSWRGAKHDAVDTSAVPAQSKSDMSVPAASPLVAKLPKDASPPPTIDVTSPNTAEGKTLSVHHGSPISAGQMQTVSG